MLKACNVCGSEISNGFIKVDLKTGKVTNLEREFEQEQKRYIKECIFYLKPRMKNKLDLTNKIVNAIMRYKGDVEPRLIVAILYQESGFNPNAISDNDIGIGQICFIVWRREYKTTIQELLDPETNIKICCGILNYLRDTRSDKFENSWYSFYNSSTWEIKNVDDQVVAGRKVYWYAILRHLKKLERVK